MLKSTIGTEEVVLKTYPFSDPSPIPQFGRLYPYNRYDGYTSTGAEQAWTMIVLENEHIKIWINPAVGGKIWGAMEKQKEQHFIYFNHVVKFRDVAMRGPWTSGGIETNMGIIGHAPSCSAPVDYFMKEWEDGSVSCFLGATDWSSRTSWQVEVRLPPHTAYFITRTRSNNGHSLEQSYYQWTNAALKTSGGLEYIFPGYKHIGHDGKTGSWPRNREGVLLSTYANNLGEYKSYHVFGTASAFWGCYWHWQDFGMGHYAPYHAKPGRKIWIWGLSRYGMIWEDLLTDSDGQYTEVQSGRAFNQSISPSSATPFKHRSFAPYTSDESEEYWFPVLHTDGLTSASPKMSFYLEQQPGTTLHICANEPLHNQLVLDDGTQRVEQRLDLETLGRAVILFPEVFDLNRIRILLGEETVYDAITEHQPLERPSQLPADFDPGSVQGIFLQAKEWERQRFYHRAVQSYRECLVSDPYFLPALSGYAGVLLKLSEWAQALLYLKKALSIDTYHPEANYLYGLAQLRLGNKVDAKDGFSIAGLSAESSPAAFTELAFLYVTENQLRLAQDCLQKSLRHNLVNREAFRLQLFLQRKTDPPAAVLAAKQMLDADPLDHVVRFEWVLLQQMDQADFAAGIQSELPHETFLEVASFYLHAGQHTEALAVLHVAPAQPVVAVWQAYLFSQEGQTAASAHALGLAAQAAPDRVFPHRDEDIRMLEWAVEQSPSWKFKYYLALCYRHQLKVQASLAVVEACGFEPDYYPFYLLRAFLQKETGQHGRESDLLQANEIAPGEWRTSHQLTAFYLETGAGNQALETAKAGRQKHPENYYLGLQLAKCLLFSSRYAEGIRLMTCLEVLPNEGASEGRILWRETHLEAALDALQREAWDEAGHLISEARRWPENLGLGRPQYVDERLEDFMALYCCRSMKEPLHLSLQHNLLNYRLQHGDKPFGAADFLSLLMLKQKGEEQKADEIMYGWTTMQPEALPRRWAAAFFARDPECLAVLDLEELPHREPLPYEIIVEDRDYRFVKKLYKLDAFRCFS